MSRSRRASILIAAVVACVTAAAGPAAEANVISPIEAYAPATGSPFATGSGPASIAASPQGTLIAAANGRSNTVSLFGFGTFSTLSPEPGSPYAAGAAPSAVAFTPNGQFVLTANSGDGTLSMFRVGAAGGMTSLGTAATIGATSRPTALAFRSDGLLAVADNGLGAVSLFHVTQSGVVTPVAGSPVSTGSGPVSVAFSPNGSLLAVADENSGRVSMFSVGASGTLSPVTGSPFAAGSGPGSVAFSPDGTLLAVADRGAPQVSMFTVATSGALTPVNGSPFMTAPDPASVAFDQVGSLLATANPESSTTSVFSVGSGGVLTPLSGSPFPTGGGPASVLFARAGGLLMTANATSDNLSVLTLAPPTVTLTAPTAGTRYVKGQSIQARYSCQDSTGGPGIASCEGTSASGAAIDTSTLGTHTYTVTALSKDGQTGFATVTYQVIPPRVADLAVSVSAPSQVLAGTAATYTITASNNGPKPARKVVVEDQIPIGSSYESASTSVGRCPRAPAPGVNRTRHAAVVCYLGTLASGATATIVVHVFDSRLLGYLINRARVASFAINASDPDTSNDRTASATAITPRSSDLSLQMAARANVRTGGLLRYTLTINNAGPDTTLGTQVIDRLPPGTRYLGSSNNKCHLAAPKLVRCSLGPTLFHNVREVIAVRATATGGDLSNRATIRSLGHDPNKANNVAGATTTIVNAAGKPVTPASTSDLAVRQIPSDLYAPINQNYTYFISVGNGGPHAASGVSLIDNLPAGTTFVSASTPGGQCQLASQVLTCALATVAVDDARVVTLTVKVNGVPDPSFQGAFLPLVNTATLVTPTNVFDPTATDDSNTLTSEIEPETIAVGNLQTTQIPSQPLILTPSPGGAVPTQVPTPPMADVSVTEQVTQPPGGYADEVVDLFTVKNNGPDTAQNVKATIAFAQPGQVMLRGGQPTQGVMTEGSTPDLNTPSEFTWNVGRLASGATAIVGFDMDISQGEVSDHLLPLPNAPEGMKLAVTQTADGSVSITLDGLPTPVGPTEVLEPQITGPSAQAISYAEVTSDTADSDGFNNIDGNVPLPVISSVPAAVKHCTKDWGFGALIMGDDCHSSIPGLTAGMGAFGAWIASTTGSTAFADVVADTMMAAYWAAMFAA